MTLSGILFVQTGIAWRHLPLELGFGSGVTCWRRLDDLIVDQSGLPLAFTLTGGNRHDSTQLLPLVDGVPAIAGRVGRPRRRPERLYADGAYDYPIYRRQLRRRGIKPDIARRGTEQGSGLGRFRWVIERTFAWLHQFRRLLVRYQRRADIHEAFLALACSLICWRRLADPN